MKYDKIRLVGASSVDLPLIGADPSGPFVLKGADGLGPPDITVFMDDTTVEKRVYQGKRAMPRQPVLRVGLQPDWNIGQTAEELRTTLYGLLTTRYGALLKFQLMLGNVSVGEAFGHISKMEIVVFSKDPEVQITMDCDYPYFLAPNTIKQTPPHSLVSGSQVIEVENDGTAPAGFRAGFILKADVGTTLTLSDNNPLGEKIQLAGQNWVTNDVFIVDTRAGQRGVWRKPGGGSQVSMLNYFDADVSNWFQLYGGPNTLRLNVSAFDWDTTNAFQHQPAYWGV